MILNNKQRHKITHYSIRSPLQVTMSSTKQLDETIPLPGSRRTIFYFESINHSITPFEDASPPVIIIGSSMVGMFMGILLGYHGYVPRLVSPLSHFTAPPSNSHPKASTPYLSTATLLQRFIHERLSSSSVR